MNINQASFDAFWYWINERERIRQKKNAGEPWPWTNDPNLQAYSFCNVSREHDTVTIAFRKMLRDPYANHPNLWFAYCLARQINWPETVAEIIDEGGFPEIWEPEIVQNIMLERQRSGKKVYTGAYMLGGGQHTVGENEKARYTVYSVLDPVWRAGEPSWVTLERATNWLAGFHGWGGFLAFETVTDWRWCRYLCGAPDINTFANAGPGCKRGLNRIFGRDTKAALGQEQALEELRWLLAESPKYLEPHVSPLELRDCEGACCEVDKHLRVKLGEGRPRARYRPPQVTEKENQPCLS